MFRGYWRTIFAAVGLALALGSGVFAQEIGNNAGGQQGTQPSAAQPQANPQPIFPPAIQDALDSIAASLKAANNPEDAAAKSQRERDDLKAQKDMATWAQGMFWVAFADTIVTIVGVFLIWRTLKATWAAKGEAQRAASAAESTVDQMRKASRRELRAYVFIDDPKPDPMTLPWGLEFYVKNFGQTPAYSIKIKYSQGRIPKEDAGSFVPPAPQREWAGKVDLGPNHDFPVRLSTDVGGVEAAPLFIWGEVTFTDAFGEQRWLRFCFIEVPATGGFRHWKIGNETGDKPEGDGKPPVGVFAT
jgi:hypothetical protein